MALKLKEIQKGFGRNFLKTANELGPILAELQDQVETLVNTTVNQVQGGGTKLVPFSFEANEVGTIKVYFPAKVTVNKIRAFVTAALSATDAGTITAKNSAGTSMASGALTIPLSSVFGYQPAAAVPTTNNVCAAGDFIELVTAKTTPGGGGFVEVEYTLTP